MGIAVQTDLQIKSTFRSKLKFDISARTWFALMRRSRRFVNDDNCAFAHCFADGFGGLEQRPDVGPPRIGADAGESDRYGKSHIAEADDPDLASVRHIRPTHARLSAAQH